MKNIIIFYILMLLLFFGFASVISEKGKVLETEKSSLSTAETKTGSQAAPEHSVSAEILAHFSHPLTRFMMQLILVVSTARLFGILFQRIRQPSVIGEILAGILLGPTLFGTVFPAGYEFLFPKNSLSILQIFSQFGLILFMFVIGMELDTSVLKNKLHTAVVVSHASIVFPFALGMSLSLYLYQKFAPSNISFLTFSLFMGIAMSITAFPVLARILQERELSKTRLGIITISCAAADDITAWSILAVIVAIAKAGSLLGAAVPIFLSILYVTFMITAVRPLLVRFSAVYASRENLTRTSVTVLFLILFVSSLTTEIIGIHALFGAFLAGTIIPGSSRLKSLIIEKIQDISLLVLLPMFFAFTGIRTRMNLFQDGMMLTALAVILTAVLGKFGGSFIAAKLSKESWKDSLSIGALMNTRGLMELVVLNVGYDLGILSAEIFSIMVLMALVTTFMTGPALDFINYIFPDRENTELPVPEKSILFSFGKPEMGYKLLQTARLLSSDSGLKAVHITPNQYLLEEESVLYREEAFRPVRDLSKSLNLELEEIYKVTENISSEILHQMKLHSPTLLLVGAAKSVLSDDIFGGTLKKVLKESPVPVGIFLESENQNFRKIIVLKKENSFQMKSLFENLKPSLPAVTVSFEEFSEKNLMKDSLICMEFHDWNESFAGMSASFLVFHFP